MSQTPTPGSGSAPAPAGRRGGSGGRAARGRLDVTTIAAVAVPLLALLAALLVDSGAAEPRSGTDPEEVALTSSSVVCPPGGPGIAVASASGADGEVSVRTGRREQSAPVGPGRISEVASGDAAAVVTGDGDLAPGLVAARFSAPLASFDCRAPVFDQWFTGVGAGAKHRSVLQLVNPDGGRASVDVEVFGRDGQVEAPRLVGIPIRGGETRAIDLARDLPRRDELALHVTVVRGRIAASVRDAFRGIGGGRSGDDGLGAQEAPATRNLLLGLPARQGPRTLIVANPGETQTRATIQLVTAESTFAPDGLDELVVPARSTVTVQVRDVLADAGAGRDRAVGLLVESAAPTTATLQMFDRGDLLGAVPVTALEGPGTAVLPAGEKTLVLGDASRPGAVTVDLWDAGGTALPAQRIEVAAGRADTLDLPAEARLVTVTGARTPAAAVVLVAGDDGATLVRVREPVQTGLVPAVTPGLP